MQPRLNNKAVDYAAQMSCPIFFPQIADRSAGWTGNKGSELIPGKFAYCSVLRTRLPSSAKNSRNLAETCQKQVLFTDWPLNRLSSQWFAEKMRDLSFVQSVIIFRFIVKSWCNRDYMNKIMTRNVFWNPHLHASIFSAGNYVVAREERRQEAANALPSRATGCRLRKYRRAGGGSKKHCVS